ncbi:MAG: addiction module protein [Verrucomicrobiia bacterium]
MESVIMEAEALRLPVAERVRLVDSLMDSLDDEAAN